MKDLRIVRFIPIRHNGRIHVGDLDGYYSGVYHHEGAHKLVGFKPKPGKKREGWLVFLLNPSKGNKPSGSR